MTDRKTILLIEDQDSIREMMVDFLDVLGYNTLSVPDPESAKAAVREQGAGISAVICDVILGSLYGPDVIREMRQWIPGAAVVYTSGYASQDLKDNGEENFRYFLAKPFSIESMKNVLERALACS